MKTSIKIFFLTCSGYTGDLCSISYAHAGLKNLVNTVHLLRFPHVQCVNIVHSSSRFLFSSLLAQKTNIFRWGAVDCSEKILQTNHCSTKCFCQNFLIPWTFYLFQNDWLQKFTPFYFGFLSLTVWLSIICLLSGF